MSALGIQAVIFVTDAEGPLVAEAVEELLLRPERATMNRPVPLLGNNGSCAGYYRFYCCAATLPHRVLQQPQPQADLRGSRVRSPLWTEERTKPSSLSGLTVFLYQADREITARVGLETRAGVAFRHLHIQLLST